MGTMPEGEGGRRRWASKKNKVRMASSTCTIMSFVGTTCGVTAEFPPLHKTDVSVTKTNFFLLEVMSYSVHEGRNYYYYFLSSSVAL